LPAGASAGLTAPAILPGRKSEVSIGAAAFATVFFFGFAARRGAEAFFRALSALGFFFLPVTGHQSLVTGFNGRA
jgi:hypothetical protein